MAACRTTLLLLVFTLAVSSCYVASASWAALREGLDFRAALLARLITAETLTTLAVGLERVRRSASDDQAVLAAGAKLRRAMKRVDLGVPAPWGQIPVRVYRPAGDGDGPFPGLLWVHGGAWSSGRHYVTDEPVIELASALGMVAVSVDYRLLPGHAFPDALNDCLRVLAWLREQSGAMGIDAERLVVRGESAGANLVVAMVLKAREAGWPPVRLQLLHQPFLDLREDTPWESRHRFASGYFLEMDWLLDVAARYAPSDARHYDSLASPILADVAGFPPTLLSVAEFDPLRDEGLAFAAALEQSGIELLVHETRGGLHGLSGSGDRQRELLEREKQAVARVLAGGRL